MSYDDKILVHGHAEIRLKSSQGEARLDSTGIHYIGREKWIGVEELMN